MMGTPPLPQNLPQHVFYTLIQWKAKFLNGTHNPKLRGVKRRLHENGKQLLECDHSLSAGGLCFLCGRQLALSTTASSPPDEKRVPLHYIMDAFSLSEEEMLTLRTINHQTHLVGKKKLSLVLDLDNTLVHSIKFQDLKEEDLANFRDFDKENIFVLSEIQMLLKLRPFVVEFLAEVSKMFELHIYTMGNRSYANTIANLLDPDESHFDWRVISREDCTNQGRKGLDVVVGEESEVVIVDDKKSIWGKYEKNVLPIKPYHFWDRGAPRKRSIDVELEFMLETLKKLHHYYFDTRSCVDETNRDVRVFILTLREFYLKRSNSSNDCLIPPTVQAKGSTSSEADTVLISSTPTLFHRRGSNVFLLLLRREISPRTRRSCPRWHHVGAPKRNVMASSGPRSETVMDARRGLLSWVEADSLQHLSAQYCPLFPPPRSTIAASFSLDGKRLASTHGDHTVKIIDCQTRRCLKVLNGHRRTPWVVRFHPREDILASGSLDHEVRLWHTITSECIGSHDFNRPVASIAFHAEDEVLAVASGHKLYMWVYNGKGDGSSPTIILKTRRSLRAVHFHPHGAPLLLTAEVNDINFADSSLTKATSSRNVQYPPPSVYVTNVHPNDNAYAAPDLSLMDFPFIYIPFLGRERFRSNMMLSSHHIETGQSTDGALGHFRPVIPGADYSEALDMQLAEQPGQRYIPESGQITNPEADRVSYISRQQEVLLSQDSSCLELPFLQGWLVGQSQANMSSGFPSQDSHGIPVAPFSMSLLSDTNLSILMAGSHRVSHSTQTRLVPSPSFMQTTASDSTSHEVNHSLPLRIQADVAASLAATAAAELPCTVKLKLWFHDVKSPTDLLDFQRCRLIIPHVVLCSEMGAHFSPCGRFLAACVACVPSHVDSDPSLLTQLNQDVLGARSSPTQHPISAREIMYELRVYSLAEATFGLVLASRAIRSAHCLTSIQFSPMSEHILLAYGRRHSLLLKSIVINGDTSLPVYTVLEVYRVSDMELVSILPSVEDEVNIASFHPSAGGGIVYGTKEGRLGILRYDRSVNMT